MNYRAIITDIEGTTSRISFVTEILFPYAAKHLPDFIRREQHTPAVASELHQVRILSGEPTADTERCITLLLQWLAADQKATPLKTLQGMIWADGYQNGAFQGHIYPDVAAKLADWQRQGIKLYVYSSGSVAAQQLLFKHSDFGDLTPLFSGYFDTRIGAKREVSAYAAILQQLQIPPRQVLFLSDVTAELDAAGQLGIATVQLVRDGQSAGKHPTAHDFYQLQEMMQ
ncbi:haloacid dehalogenase [Arsukibacterium ikkense]|uniref:Enolase-phosphatase E1 n=1 Tax=Arsukibacterium ikkense TaxID=336831 RepID=A0A0M2V2D3_9GAMM|nr:acireductone synthase [Arsukibacterium ikkense]KKO44544.1 haloacid dehalogenase [Arsukibacterium ikkense]